MLALRFSIASLKTSLLIRNDQLQWLLEIFSTMISIIYSHPGTILIGVAITLSMLYQFFRSISLYVRRQKFMAEHGCQPVLHHYPHRDPILGLDYIRANLTALKHKNYLKTVTKRFHDIGATFDVRVINQPAIVTAEPENIKAVLALRFQDFTLGNRPQVMGDFLGRGIFTTDGNEWAHSRAMLRPNFVKEQVGDLKALERHVQNLFRLIPLNGSTVDLQPLFFRFALDSATEFLFGDSVCSLDQSAEANHKFGQAFNYSMGELALRFRLGPFVAFRRNKKATEAFNVCRTYVDRFVDDAMKYRQNHEMKDFEKEGNLFLQELAKTTDSKERIRDELLNILVAGRDTTASLLSHMLFEISRKPDVWGCLQKEASFLEGKPPTYQQLKEMKYLKFTVQESKLAKHTVR